MLDSNYERPVIVPARAVSARYGVSSRTINRWLASETLSFPQPMRVNGRRYWREADLLAWERARSSSVQS